jgi:beta-N-acetylhexosaminidase
MSDAQVHQDAGQVLMGGFVDVDIDPAFSQLVESGRVGGAILFRRNIESPAQTQDLLQRLTALQTSEPLMYAVDQEGGRVQRLRDPFPELPPMRVFGDAGRKTLARRAGALLGRTLRAIGFHQDFAPVLDVDSNPDNPVIGDRAFSNDPNIVARLGAAFIDGMQTEGMAACAKHFPGHGDTNVDSHLALPRLDHDLERLRAVELVPFRAAVAVDVASIMTAHILFSAFDDEHPATLSEKVMGPLVRDEVGYRGVVVSDDLEMRAVADHYGVADAAVRSIRAGCDQILICKHPELIAEAHEALVKAVESKTLSKYRLAEAAQRVRLLKQRYVQPRPSANLSEVLADPDLALILSELSNPSAFVGPDPTEPEEFEYALEGGAELELDV